ncbi:ankyrin repeat domain-containing protein 39 isoform 1-T1 [Ciconia maguari]
MAAGRRSPPGRCCPSRVAVPSVHQSLPEMDFERGIWSAARDGDEPRVLQLLERRGEPSQPDLAGYTALHYASRNGHLGVCRLLLQRGARCDARTPGGATPLHRASYCGHLAVARLLLAHGADPAAADEDGRTSLHKVGGRAGTSSPTTAATGLAGAGDDGRVTRRRLNEATANSASCSCGTARRWPASAMPRADGPGTWPTRRCRTCWIPEGDTAGPGEPEPPRRRTPGAAGPRLRWINEAPGTQRRLCLSVPCAGCRGSPLSGGLAAAGGVTAPFFGCQPFQWLLFPQKTPLKIGQIVFCRTRKHRRASVWWGHPVPVGSVPRWGSRHRAPSPQLVPQPPAPTPASSRERRGGRKASVLALRFLVGRFGVACGRANSSR